MLKIEFACAEGRITFARCEEPAMRLAIIFLCQRSNAWILASDDTRSKNAASSKPPQAPKSIANHYASILRRSANRLDGEITMPITITTWNVQNFAQTDPVFVEKLNGAASSMRTTDVQADPMAVVRRIYKHFRMPLPAESEAAMGAWLNRDRGDHASGPRHAYSAEEFGVDHAEIDRHFGDYLGRYNVALER